MFSRRRSRAQLFFNPGDLWNSCLTCSRMVPRYTARRGIWTRWPPSSPCASPRYRLWCIVPCAGFPRAASIVMISARWRISHGHTSASCYSSGSGSFSALTGAARAESSPSAYPSSLLPGLGGPTGWSSGWRRSRWPSAGRRGCNSATACPSGQPKHPPACTTPTAPAGACHPHRPRGG